MAKTTRLRRALRAFSLFTRAASDHSSSHQTPYTEYVNRPLSGPRVF